MKQVFDFHSHSNYSDGTLSPSELMQYAAERDIERIALTDHDSTSGLSEAGSYIQNKELGVRLFNGVELSALTDNGEVHVVGLGLDITNEQLEKALSEQQSKRWERAEKICDKLEKSGVHGVFEACKLEARQVITRTHIAKSIVAKGYVKDMKQAFKRYIGKGGRIAIPKEWMSLAEAIAIIAGANGISVLAHPTRYPLSNRKLANLIQEFASLGGDAIEGAYPSLTRDKMDWLKTHAKINGLMFSSGSDFHYPDLKWTDLGRFPMVDSSLPHVHERLI